MVATISNLNPDLVSTFTALSTDQQLALLWFIYKEVGNSITPAAPGSGNASLPVAEGLLKQVVEMPHAEQLQVQRDLVEHKNTLISREYGALSDTTKLLFWYLLAQGMDRSEVIPMPSDYSLQPQATQALAQLQQLAYSEQITVLRDFVANMGVEATSSNQDDSTGL